MNLIILLSKITAITIALSVVSMPAVVELEETVLTLQSVVKADTTNPKISKIIKDQITDTIASSRRSVQNIPQLQDSLLEKGQPKHPQPKKAIIVHESPEWKQKIGFFKRLWNYLRHNTFKPNDPKVRAIIDG